MAYRYSQEKMTALLLGVQGPVADWRTGVESVNKAADSISKTDAMKGKGPDNVKQYMEDVHGSISVSFAALFEALQRYVSTYNSAYFTLDGSTSAIIDEKELSDFSASLKCKITNSQTISDNVQQILDSVDDICYIPFSGTVTAEDAMGALKTKLDTLNQDIADIETWHQNEPISEIEQLLNSLTAFIREEINRKDIAGYTRQSLIESTAYGNLVEHCNTLIDSLNKDAELIKKAYETQNEMFDQLQEEYEERQKKAKIITGIVAVVGVVATIATAGAAAPVVIGTAAAVGAVSAGVSCAANMYVGDITGGGMDKINWGTVATHAAIGGVTSAVCAGIGAGASSLTSTATQKVTSTVAKSAIKVGISSAQGVVTGSITRASTTYMQTGSLEEAVDAAFDGKSMLADAAGGIVSGTVGEALSASKLKETPAFVRGATTEVLKNSSSTFTKDWIKTGSITEAAQNATNPETLVFDALVGGTTEVVVTHRTTTLTRAEEEQIQRKIDEETTQANTPKKGKLSAADRVKERVTGDDDGVKSGKNNCVDFEDSSAIARSPDGEALQYSVKTGSGYADDFKAGDEAIQKSLGVSCLEIRKGSGGTVEIDGQRYEFDNGKPIRVNGKKYTFNRTEYTSKNGNTSTYTDITIGKHKYSFAPSGKVVIDGREYTQHHLADYDVSDQTCTMQLVDKEAHEASKGHRGGNHQREMAMEERNNILNEKGARYKKRDKTFQKYLEMGPDGSGKPNPLRYSAPPDKLSPILN